MGRQVGIWQKPPKPEPTQIVIPSAVFGLRNLGFRDSFAQPQRQEADSSLSLRDCSE
jgi:hypothetical protein